MLPVSSVNEDEHRGVCEHISIVPRKEEERDGVDSGTCTYRRAGCRRRTRPWLPAALSRNARCGTAPQRGPSRSLRMELITFRWSSKMLPSIAFLFASTPASDFAGMEVAITCIRHLNVGLHHHLLVHTANPKPRRVLDIQLLETNGERLALSP